VRTPVCPSGAGYHPCPLSKLFLVQLLDMLGFSSIAGLIFDLMDLNYGMNSMKDSSVVLLINLKKN